MSIGQNSSKTLTVMGLIWMLFLAVLSLIAFSWAIVRSWLTSRLRRLLRTLRSSVSWVLRPYFLEVRADQILGWRKDGDTPLAQVNQIRINEYVTEPLGAFGDKVVRQIRVLEQGKWSTWRKGENGWALHEEGTTSLPVIPLAVTYSGKLGELMSKPPLLPVANLNILHSQRQADQQFSLHVAAMPILVLKGWDDSDNEIALSANSALVMSPDGDAKYVEPASQAFQAQQDFITEIEQQDAEPRHFNAL